LTKNCKSNVILFVREKQLEGASIALFNGHRKLIKFAIELNMRTVCWLAIVFVRTDGTCFLFMLLFCAVRRSPTKPKEVANLEKKTELEKRLENVQNVLGTSQTTKKPKPGQF